jgi:RND family efflux transporter MFP subunit
MTRTIWMSAALLAALLLAPASRGQSGGMPPSPVMVEEARLETAEQWREVTGELRAARRALLATEEEGLVVALELQEGDQVKAGQVVARHRDTRAKLDVARAEADLAVKAAMVAEREADIDKARRDVARMEELQARSSAAGAEVEDKKILLKAAEARLTAAKADVDSARSALDWAKERMARMVISAPFAATVTMKRTEVGQWVKQGESLVEVVALDQIDARLDVPEAYINQLAASHAPVRIRLTSTGEIVEAPVSAIVPDADQRSRLFPVRVRVQNPGERLRPGLSVVALVPTGKNEPTLTVPKDAILRNDAGEYVLFNAGGTAAPAPVKSLYPVGERMAVSSTALRPGVQVIVEGNERLFPGMPIAPTVRPGKTPAAAGEVKIVSDASTSSIRGGPPPAHSESKGR